MLGRRSSKVKEPTKQEFLFFGSSKKFCSTRILLHTKLKQIVHIENLGSGSIGCLVKTALTGHDGRKWTQPAGLGLGCSRDQLGLPQLGCWRAPELPHCCRPAELAHWCRAPELPQQQNPTGQVCASHLPPLHLLLQQKILKNTETPTYLWLVGPLVNPGCV